jgi:hypothetical protein
MESVVVDVGSTTLRVGHGNDVPSIRVPLLPPSYAPSLFFFIYFNYLNELNWGRRERWHDGGKEGEDVPSYDNDTAAKRLVEKGLVQDWDRFAATLLRCYQGLQVQPDGALACCGPCTCSVC